MTSKLARFALACLAMMVSASGALAAGNPIPNIDVIVKKDSGDVIARSRTDAAGNFSLGVLRAGTYVVELEENSLRRAVMKLGRDPSQSLLLLAYATDTSDSKLAWQVFAGVRQQPAHFTITVPAPAARVGVAGTKPGRATVSGKAEEYRGIITLETATGGSNPHARASGSLAGERDWDGRTDDVATGGSPDVTTSVRVAGDQKRLAGTASPAARIGQGTTLVRLDRVTTAKSCTSRHGTVVIVEGV